MMQLGDSGDSCASVSFLAAPGPHTRAQMVRELICSTLYLKQQVPCPLRDIEAQAQSDGKGPALRKYRQYINALDAIRDDLASLFHNDLLQVLEVRVLFGVSWTTPKDGVVLNFEDCQPEINDETIDDMEDSKADAYCRKLLRAAIPVVGGHTLAMNKMHVVVKAIANPELAGSGWHHRLQSLVLAKAAPKARKLARNCREPSRIDLVAPPPSVGEPYFAGQHMMQPVNAGFTLEIYDESLHDNNAKRKRSRDEAASGQSLQESQIHAGDALEEVDQDIAAAESDMQLEQQAVPAAKVVWLHSRRGLRGLAR